MDFELQLTESYLNITKQKVVHFTGQTRQLHATAVATRAYAIYFRRYFKNRGVQGHSLMSIPTKIGITFVGYPLVNSTVFGLTHKVKQNMKKNQKYQFQWTENCAIIHKGIIFFIFASRNQHVNAMKHVFFLIKCMTNQ